MKDKKHLPLFGVGPIYVVSILLITALAAISSSKGLIPKIEFIMRTVMGADKIVVLSDGVVKECGTPDELLKQNGVFANMVRTQTESESWMI